MSNVHGMVGREGCFLSAVAELGLSGMAEEIGCCKSNWDCLSMLSIDVVAAVDVFGYLRNCSVAMNGNGDVDWKKVHSEDAERLVAAVNDVGLD